MPGKNDQRYKITIRNWGQYQREMRGGEKRRRRREWVAISVDLFSDTDFLELDHVHARLWLGLLLHSGKVGPEFYMTPARAVSMFCLKRPCDFSVLANQGFIDLKAATNKTEIQKTDTAALTAFNEKMTQGRFDDFWAVYPKKLKKAPSKKKWASMKLDKVADLIIENVKYRLENDNQWRNGYIPDPTTYLNQRRWEDEMIQTKEAGSGESYAERAARAADNVGKATRKSDDSTG